MTEGPCTETIVWPVKLEKKKDFTFTSASASKPCVIFFLNQL